MTFLICTKVDAFRNGLHHKKTKQNKEQINNRVINPITNDDQFLYDGEHWSL